jgi:predicted Co/Zn/Cd cation transporter (cation efflux family)
LPLGTVRQAVSEILLMAPPELVAHVERVAASTAECHGFADFEAYVAKIGRSQQIELYFLVPVAFAIAIFAGWMPFARRSARPSAAKAPTAG